MKAIVPLIGVLSFTAAAFACDPPLSQPQNPALSAGSTAPLMRTLVVSDDEESDAPRPWLGVLMAPVPPALAAHVGPGGLMISNVVKGSPADKAGLEQYDIVRSFNGKPADDMQAFIDAIREVGIGTSAELVVLHGGQQKTISIAPDKRSDPSQAEYKYGDPEDVIVDNSTAIRGHMLRMGPDGRWRLEQLGALNGMPDVLTKLWQPDDQTGPWIDPFDPQGDDMNGPDADEDAPDEHCVFRIEQNRDGQRLSIARDDNGKIKVTRTDKDGAVTSAEYADMAELQAKDPEAYEAANHAAVGRGDKFWIKVRPPNGELPHMQQHFQQMIERHLRAIPGAAERAAAARKEADAQLNAAERMHQQAVRERLGMWEKRIDGPAAEKDVEVLMERSGAGRQGLAVTINDDGGIEVVSRKNGESVTYKFKDKADFEKREPELYKRYQAIAE